MNVPAKTRLAEPGMVEAMPQQSAIQVRQQTQSCCPAWIHPSTGGLGCSMLLSTGGPILASRQALGATHHMIKKYYQSIGKAYAKVQENLRVQQDRLDSLPTSS